ncbi:hypothetical protein XK22_06765 [Streptococcus suis]|nr:hypothetical protein XK22_06765 [Streptococcus suis]
MMIKPLFFVFSILPKIHEKSMGKEMKYHLFFENDSFVRSQYRLIKNYFIIVIMHKHGIVLK